MRLCSICKKPNQIIYKDEENNLFICNDHPELLHEIDWKLSEEVMQIG
jgi:hypothetical protein